MDKSSLTPSERKGAFNVREYLRRYCPSVVAFVNLPQSQWDKINDQYLKRINYLRSIVTLGKAIDAETTLPDLIVSAETGEPIQTAFLKFIDDTVKMVAEKVDPIQYGKLRDALANMLSNFDDRRSCYLDRIGEFSSLLKIIQDEKFHLRELEAQLPNGKRADFLFDFQERDMLVWVDVLNIHFKPDRIHNEEDLYTFLSGRIKQKREQKFSGMNIDQPGNTFSVLPIVWCELEEIRTYSSTFLRVADENNATSFCILSQRVSAAYKYSFELTTVENTLARFNQSEH